MTKNYIFCHGAFMYKKFVNTVKFFWFLGTLVFCGCQGSSWLAGFRDGELFIQYSIGENKDEKKVDNHPIAEPVSNAPKCAGRARPIFCIE